MQPKRARQALVWGGLLILTGALLLVETVTDLSVWVWIVALAAGALVATGLYLTDRSDWAMLVTTYALWVIALLILLVELNVLRDEAVATFFLVAIALPFLAIFFRDRTQWWALIPAYVMVVIGVMVGLIGLGVLDDMLVPAYVLTAIAIPFFVVYALNRKNWWALIPGGILAAVALGFLVAEAAVEYVGAFVLVGIGVLILVRGLMRRDSGEDGPPS